MGAERHILSAVLCLLSFLLRSDAAWIRGETTVKPNGAAFIGKFCFDYDVKLNNSGEVDFTMLSADPAKGLVKILLLDDQRESYPDGNSRWPGFSCDGERLKVAAKTQTTVPLEQLRNDGRLHTYIVERIRPRWWFVVVLDCSGIQRTISYDLHMINVKSGWLRELSLDRCGIAAIAIFCGVYTIICLAQLYAVFRTSEMVARTKHPLRLLLTFGICAAVWGMAFFLLDSILFAIRGVETFLLYLASRVLKAWSKFTLLLILLLLSKGCGVSRDLRPRDIWQGSFLIGPFLLICIWLEMYGEYDQSRKYTTDFVYRTWVGGLLVLADLVLLVIYGLNVRTSYQLESSQDKKMFYSTWGSAYSLAFLTLPIAVLISPWFSAWVRSEVLFLINNITHSILLSLLVAGLWPENSQTPFCIDNKDLASTFGNQSGLLDVADADAELSAFNAKDGVGEGNG